MKNVCLNLMSLMYFSKQGKGWDKDQRPLDGSVVCEEGLF